LPEGLPVRLRPRSHRHVLAMSPEPRNARPEQVLHTQNTFGCFPARFLTS
jgi:hypothetical protein